MEIADPNNPLLILTKEQRESLWKQLTNEVETYISVVDRARLTPSSSVSEIDAILSGFDFEEAADPNKVVEVIVAALWKHQTHVSNSRYFGLFNPPPSTMGIIADTLVAAFNPQAGSWNHSPFAVQLENRLLRLFARRFGLSGDDLGGVFCTGGAEANHTAILTALVNKFPRYTENGLHGSDLRPALYVSTQTHHSILKAARLCGLGSRAVRFVDVDNDLKMDLRQLEYRIERDLMDGWHPFMIVGTAGTTNAGAIDPIGGIAAIAKRFSVWFHADAAWGGAAALFTPEICDEFGELRKADSITFDAHKWMSVPMAAGMYLTSQKDILARTFNVQAEYMTGETPVAGIPDPYVHSLQWSRRFIGLKVFMSLAVAGWEGYRKVIQRQIELGDLLREELQRAGWHVVNRTPLPVVCFTDASSNAELLCVGELKQIAEDIVQSGEVWMSCTTLSNDAEALRACITNCKTTEYDIKHLIDVLVRVRKLSLQRRGDPFKYRPLSRQSPEYT